MTLSLIGSYCHIHHHHLPHIFTTSLWTTSLLSLHHLLPPLPSLSLVSGTCSAIFLLHPSPPPLSPSRRRPSLPCLLPLSTISCHHLPLPPLTPSLSSPLSRARATIHLSPSSLSTLSHTTTYLSLHYLSFPRCRLSLTLPAFLTARPFPFAQLTLSFAQPLPHPHVRKTLDMPIGGNCRESGR